MRLNALRQGLCIAALLAGSGCADNPVLPSHPYDGNWVARFPEPFRRVRFHIVLSRITYFESDVRLPGCWVPITSRPQIAVSGNEFTFNASDSLFSSIVVTGRFDTDRKLTGTVGSGTLRAISFCGATSGHVTEPVAFTAEQ